MQNGNVIVCIINYRVGLMGFLSTEDEVLPGNLGLKDQVKALTFIQENIQAFGGNPKLITLAGGSSGSSSLHLMYLSPLTEDLFNYGYDMSGSAFSCWSMQEAANEKAKRIASEPGCPTNSSKDLVSCLKTKPGRDIVGLTRLFQPFFTVPFSPFAPVVEPPNENAFLTQNPYDMILTGQFQDKPLILSLVQKEGLYPAASYIANEANMAEINDRWNEFAPHLLDFYFTIAQDIRDDVSQAIRKFYFQNETISVKNADELVQMISDRLYNLDVSSAAVLQAAESVSSIYMYMFSYRGAHSISEIFSRTTTNYGTCHGDDTAYALNTVVLDPEETADDIAMINTFVGMWTSYAKTGRPSFGKGVSWPRVSPLGVIFGGINYLEVRSPKDFRHRSRLNYGNREFWHNLRINEPTSGRYA